MELGDLLAIMKYGDNWRFNRRLFHQEFNSSTAGKFKEMQTRCSQSVAVHPHKPQITDFFSLVWLFD